MRWQGAIDDLLYDDEQVRETVEFDTGRVVATDRRVLAFTPEGDGKHFEEVERPNVTGVELGTTSDRGALWNVAQYVLTGALLVVVSLVLDFESMFGDVSFNSESADQIGAGGITSAGEQVVELFVWVGRAMGVVGVLVLLAGIAFAVRYWRQRTLTLEITVAGDEENIRLARPDEGVTARNRLESALFPDRRHDRPS